MSCQETCIGRVEEISLDRIKSRLESIGKTSGEIQTMTHGEIADFLRDNDMHILYVKGKFFEYQNDKLYKDDPDISYMSLPSINGPNKMTYVVSFYNGGTCLSEVLYDLIKSRI